MVKWNRTDANQGKIEGCLRDIPGVSVVSINQVGGGVPDILVGYRGRNYLFEIKDPDQPLNKRKLKNPQKTFHMEWRGQIAVVETFGEIFAIIKENQEWESR